MSWLVGSGSILTVVDRYVSLVTTRSGTLRARGLSGQCVLTSTRTLDQRV
jgi:hypothetical protein